MNDLAATFSYQGQPKEAEKLEVEVLEIRRRVLGPEHPNTLRSMHSLGVTYQWQQRWGEAKELLAKSAELSQKVMGDHHPLTQQRILDLSECLEEEAQNCSIAGEAPVSLSKVAKHFPMSCLLSQWNCILNIQEGKSLDWSGRENLAEEH
ncbi:hypothetical protein CVT26_012866 [Gymnopilus dilepis]|uniref:Kinesin light chain n=1 Tax=Gymnopilus dilepis TaxID=231916 RepID=A0A409YNU1_9AGAR|nr:hypothetical protein CVT26_012866 [Gymnopilus dilepis]